MGRDKRRLAAILAADIVGYSRLMGADESGTLAQLKTHRKELIDPKIAEYDGHIVKTTGDGLLVEFPSVLGAVQCAVDIQRAMAQRNTHVPDDKRVQYRMGINQGDVIVDEDDIYGDGINVASRLEGIAEPGGICVSGRVHEDARDKLDLKFEDLGAKELKNIARPVQVYALRLSPEPAQSKGPEPALPDKPSIAVLPFENMSGDPEQEYFSDGIAEDIITSLSKISRLFVVARNSTFTYKGRAVNVKQVGQELGVLNILEGSVRKAGNRVRITAQLVDATTGGHLWAEKYDRDLDDIFAVQDEVTGQIVSALQVKLSEGERNRLVSREPLPAEAYDLLLRGREQVMLFTKEGNARAREYYEEALETAPENAEIYSSLALTYSQESSLGWSSSPSVSSVKAFEYARMAIAIDDSLPRAHGVLGHLLVWSKQHDQAIAENKRWIELDPNGADAYLGLAFAFTFAGRPEEAITLLEQSMRLNPNYTFLTLFTLGHSHFLLQQYDDAIAALERGVLRNPNFVANYVYLAASYAETGRKQEARANLVELQNRGPEGFRPMLADVCPYKRAEDLDHLRRALGKAGGLPE